MTNSTKNKDYTTALGAIFEPDDIIEFRAIYPSPKQVDSRWVLAGDANTLNEWLAQKNSAGFNIYFGANPRADYDVRGDKNVPLARCLFVDFDKNTQPDDAEQQIVSAGLPQPSLIVNSGHGIHCYWGLSEPVTDMQLWTRMQKALIENLATDPCIHNPERIMRLPGFRNHKPPAAPSTLVRADASQRRYSLGQFPLPDSHFVAPSASAHPSADTVESFLREALATAIPSTRNNTGFELARQLRDAGISQSEAAVVMQDYVDGVPLGDEPYTTEEADATLRQVYDQPPQGGSRSTAGNVSSATSELRWRTDVGNAERFVARHKDKVRYCGGLGWLVWDVTRWKLDDIGMAMEHAKDAARTVAKQEINSPHPDEKRIRFALGSENAARLGATLKLAASDPAIAIRAADLDTNDWLLNVQNGTLNLKTGKLQEHRQTDLITKIAPVEFDPAAECPLFDAFLTTIFNDDTALIRYVMKLLGLSLTGDASAENLWIFYGNGANGKSTLLNIVRYLLGDHAGLASETLLTMGRDEHPCELADLQGKRLVVASETEENARLKLQLVKRLTGEKTIKARLMYGNYFEFRRTHKLIMQTNNRPRISENTEAAWRRIRLVPFNVTIPPDQRDTRLTEKLQVEAPGILRKLVQGCMDWQRSGLDEPEAVKTATREYRSDDDPLTEFLEDRATVGAELWTPSNKLYSAYCEYTEEAKMPLMGRRAFGMAIGRHGFTPNRGNRGRIWRGIGLKPQEGGHLP